MTSLKAFKTLWDVLFLGSFKTSSVPRWAGISFYASCSTSWTFSTSPETATVLLYMCNMSMLWHMCHHPIWKPVPPSTFGSTFLLATFASRFLWLISSSVSAKRLRNSKLYPNDSNKQPRTTLSRTLEASIKIYLSQWASKSFYWHRRLLQFLMNTARQYGSQQITV